MFWLQPPKRDLEKKVQKCCVFGKTCLAIAGQRRRRPLPPPGAGTCRFCQGSPPALNNNTVISPTIIRLVTALQFWRGQREGTMLIYDKNDQQSSTNDTISFNLCTKVGTLQIPCVFKTKICHSAFAYKRRYAHTHQIQHKCIHSVNFKNSTTTTYYILFTSNTNLIQSTF